MNCRLLLAALMFVSCDVEPTVDGGTSDAGRSVDAGVDAGAATIDAGLPPDAGPLQVAAFADTYLGESWGACNRSYGIAGSAPSTTGKKYPLFIYLVGTLDNFGHSTSFPYTAAQPNQVVLSILEEAASRGLVAVSPEYDNFFLLSCGGLRTKTRCVFDPMEANGVVAKMCARPDVDCNLGIIVAGHSQGSQLASYARNWNSRVRAVWGLGVTSDVAGSFGGGDQPGISNPTGTADDQCGRDDSTAIPADRTRYVNGLDEVCYPTSTPPYDPALAEPSSKCGLASSQGELERMSGATCPAASMSCLGTDGSGWVIVPSAGVQGGSAHHTWFGVAVDGGPSTLEASFAPPSTHPWSLGPNLAWLAQFTGTVDTLPVRLDTGAAAAIDGAFSKDDLYQGGSVATSTAAIDVTAPGAARAALYQSYRFAWPGSAVTYEVPGLMPNTPYAVRLHFAETFFSTSGSRRFHVDLQDIRRETNLDVFAEAGGMNKALVKTYTVTTSYAGKIRIALPTGSANGPMLSGLEVF